MPALSRKKLVGSIKENAIANKLYWRQLGKYYLEANYKISYLRVQTCSYINKFKSPYSHASKLSYLNYQLLRLDVIKRELVCFIKYFNHVVFSNLSCP